MRDKWDKAGSLSISNVAITERTSHSQQRTYAFEFSAAFQSRPVGNCNAVAIRNASRNRVPLNHHFGLVTLPRIPSLARPDQFNSDFNGLADFTEIIVDSVFPASVFLKDARYKNLKM